jgi:hypothetical protein
MVTLKANYDEMVIMLASISSVKQVRNWLQLNKCLRKVLEKFIVAQVNKFTSSVSTET